MNGRVYDYNVGRFLSVDPFIQGEGNSQGINPYSYIMNNPLAGVDPTGYMINCAMGMGGICDGGLPGGQKNGPTDYGPNCPFCVQTDGSAPQSSGAEGKDGQPAESDPTVINSVTEIGVKNEEGFTHIGMQVYVDIDGLLDSSFDILSHISEPQLDRGQLKGLCNGRGDCFKVSDGLDKSDGVALLGTLPFLVTRKSVNGVRVTNSSLALPAPTHLTNASGKIISYVTKQDEIFYRVFSGDSTVGAFLTKVPPKSKAFAQEALALPPQNQADFLQQVLVPAGTRLQRSRAAPVPKWGRNRGGAEQFELLERIPVSNFGEGVPLK